MSWLHSNVSNEGILLCIASHFQSTLNSTRPLLSSSTLSTRMSVSQYRPLCARTSPWVFDMKLGSLFSVHMQLLFNGLSSGESHRFPETRILIVVTDQTTPLSSNTLTFHRFRNMLMRLLILSPNRVPPSHTAHSVPYQHPLAIPL